MRSPTPASSPRRARRPNRRWRGDRQGHGRNREQRHRRFRVNIHRERRLRRGRRRNGTGQFSGLYWLHPRFLLETGATSLDLGDIAFGTSTNASFAGTAASGLLTVTDGAHTAKIKLLGNYTGSTFMVSSDGHGGTTVIDPTPPAQAPAINLPPSHPFISAMAGFSAHRLGFQNRTNSRSSDPGARCPRCSSVGHSSPIKSSIRIGSHRTRRPTA